MSSRVIPQQYTKYEELPPNAVKLSRKEVVKLQMDRIAKWPSKLEVWPFRFEQHIIAGTTAGTAYVIDQTVRKMFILGSYQPLMTLAPTLIVPCICNMIAYTMSIQDPVLSGDATCKSCFAIRGGSVHAAVSTLYPLAISPLSCYVLARHYHSYGGRFSRNQVELFKILKLPKNGKTLLLTFLLGNYVIGGFLAIKQMECFENVLLKKRSATADLDRY